MSDDPDQITVSYGELIETAAREIAAYVASHHGDEGWSPRAESLYIASGIAAQLSRGPTRRHPVAKGLRQQDRD